MIDYDNKEERKVLSEAIAKYFPMDSIRIVNQNNSYSLNNDPVMSVQQYFDTLPYDRIGDSEFVLVGKHGWELGVTIDNFMDTVKFSSISNKITNFGATIKHCDFRMVAQDPIDLLTDIFIYHRYEYRLARFLFKLRKAANTRRGKEDTDDKIKMLKEELL